MSPSLNMTRIVQMSYRVKTPGYWPKIQGGWEDGTLCFRSLPGGIYRMAPTPPPL